MKKIIFIAILLFSTFAIGQKFQNGHVDVPMTTTEMNAISSPVEGQTISNSTTDTKWFYLGGEWRDSGNPLIDASGFSGNLSTDIDDLVKLANALDTLTISAGSVSYDDLTDVPANIDEDSTDDVTLTDSQTITSSKTFSNQITLDGDVYLSQNSGSVGLSNNSDGSDIKFTTSTVGVGDAIFDFVNLDADRTYTLPDASGTIALTSDITGTSDASDLTSGVLADARVQESNITQHEDALTIPASNVTITDTGDNFTATDVESALSESLSKDDDAVEISFAPNGSIEATNVQTAIIEVRDEAGGITDVVDDTTPQLGGNLDGQSTYGLLDMINIESEAVHIQDGLNRAWQLTNGPFNLIISSEDVLGGGAFTTRATIDLDGSPSLSTDLITKDYADANYSGGSTTITDQTGTADRVLYTDGSGDVTELALGVDGTVFTSNGPTSAPSFETPSDNSLSEADQAITEDRDVTISGTGTNFNIGNMFQIDKAATSADDKIHLGIPGQALDWTSNDGWTFRSPFTFFRNTAPPTNVEARTYYDDDTNTPYFYNGSNWIEFATGNVGDPDQNATEVPMTGYVEGSDDSAPDSGDNVAEAIAKLKNITDGLGSTYPSTAQKHYIVGASTSHTMSDADFAAGNEYKSVKYEGIDTLQVAALTNGTHGRKSFLVNPWDKDSTYIKKPEGVDFFVAGQLAAISGDGLIVKDRHTVVGEQVDATSMLWSGKLTVHTDVTAQFYPYNDPLAIGTEESNDISGFSDPNFSFTLLESGDSPAPQDGDFAILAEKTGNANNFEFFQFRVGDLTIGNTYRIEIYCENVSSDVWDVQLSTNYGWGTSTLQSVPTGSGWHKITVESDANEVDAEIRINNSLELGQQIAIDNIVVTDLGVIP